MKNILMSILLATNLLAIDCYIKNMIVAFVPNKDLGGGNWQEVELTECSNGESKAFVGDEEVKISAVIENNGEIIYVAEIK